MKFEWFINFLALSVISWKEECFLLFIVDKASFFKLIQLNGCKQQQSYFVSKQSMYFK